MGNESISDNFYSYVRVEEAPGVDGVWCAPVGGLKEKTDKLFFSYRGGGVVIVTIQFICPTDLAWTDYLTDETLENGARFLLEDNASGVKWRVGVKQGGYSSDISIIGLDWIKKG